MPISQVAIRVFHVAPTFLVFIATAVLLAVIARKKKDRGVLLLAFGLIVLVAAMASLQVFYFEMEHMWVMSDRLMRVLYQVAIWLPLGAGVLMLGGAWLMHRQEKTPNQSPQPTRPTGG